MAEFTKGEWKVYTDGMACITDIVAEDGVGFFTETVAHIKRSNANYEANARLIASAPEMYEALQVARQVMEISEVNHAMKGQVGKEPYLRICEALAKVEA